MTDAAALMSLTRSTVDERISTLLAQSTAHAADAGILPSLITILDPSATLLSGGKRMRAALAACGVCLSPHTDLRATATSPLVAHIGAALELYQASALVHDDVIDDAHTRRGHPATHIALTQAHERASWQGSAELFGRNAAILVGDLLAAWAGRECTLACVASPAQDAQMARMLFDEMVAEVAIGQYLDIRAEHLPLPATDVSPQHTGSQMYDDAIGVVRRKSARYSVRNPLLIGAHLGGVTDDDALGLLADIGENIGVAFQLRDDELGVFGDPTLTGKPAGDDLREGKRTALVALTWSRCSDSERELLRDVLSGQDISDATIAHAARIIEDCGARAEHDEMIRSWQDAGMDALADLRDLAHEGRVMPAAVDILEHMCEQLTHRVS